MAVTLDLATLFVAKTAAQILDAALEFATFLGLPVTSWRTGDPTKTQFEAMAEHLAILDQNLSEYVKGGYLDTAEGVWLTIYAEQAYGVTRGAATVASGELTLTNSGAGVYSWDANDLTFTNPTTGKTYKNTEAVSLSGVGATATFTFAAEEAGSASTTGVDTLELLTSVLGVTVTDNEIAVGIDEQSDSELRTACRESLAALSPNGPTDAYRFVATNSELTGATTCNKVAVYADDPTGTVTVYVSDYADQVSAPDLVLVENALRLWCLPLAVSLEVINAEQYDQTVTVDLTVKESPLTEAEVEALAELALQTLYVATPIGGSISRSAHVGAVYAAIASELGPEYFVSATLVVPNSALGVSLDPDQNVRTLVVTVNVTVEE